VPDIRVHFISGVRDATHQVNQNADECRSIVDSYCVVVVKKTRHVLRATLYKRDNRNAALVDADAFATVDECDGLGVLIINTISTALKDDAVKCHQRKRPPRLAQRTRCPRDADAR
jgi:hypothetical protein